MAARPRKAAGPPPAAARWVDAGVLRAASAQASGLPADGAADADWFRARQAWTTLLLRQTLEHAAASVPHYRAQGWDARRFERLSDLPRLVPPTTKATIVAAPAAFLSESEPAESFHCTSGTTGRRLTVYGHAGEAEALAALLQLRADAAPAEPAVALRLFPNTLRLFAPPSRVASTAYNLVVNFSLTQTHHQWFDNTDHLVEVLGQDYLLGGRPRRISVIHATPPYLMDFLTRQLRQRGVDARRFGVEAVALSGGFVSPALRLAVEREWKAEVACAYSCTEVRGEAPELRGQPGVYLPGPTMHAELVDTATGEPVADGECGELLLTALAPFQVVMPLLRYRTGDVAQRVPLPGHAGAAPFALRVLGRLGHVAQTAPRQAVGTLDVVRAVAAFDEVPQFPYPRHRLLREGDAVVLAVETTDVPWRGRATLGRRIARALAAELSARGMAPPRIEVRPVVKGELEGHARLYPER